MTWLNSRCVGIFIVASIVQQLDDWFTGRRNDFPLLFKARNHRDTGDWVSIISELKQLLFHRRYEVINQIIPAVDEKNNQTFESLLEMKKEHRHLSLRVDVNRSILGVVLPHLLGLCQ